MKIIDKIRSKKLLLCKVNNAHQILFDNYTNGSIPLLKKQEELTVEIEELELSLNNND